MIAEIVFVLSSRKHYGLERAAIRDLLAPLLGLRGIRLEHRRIYLRALDVFAEQRVDFEDALTVAHCEYRRLAAVVSYDTGFDEIAGMVRHEP